MGADAGVQVRLPVMIQENHPAMTTTDDRTYLAVPYDEKDDAKQLGAKWDRQAKAWYVPAGVDLEAFTPWLPAHGSGPHRRGRRSRRAVRRCDARVRLAARMARCRWTAGCTASPVEGDKRR